MPLLPLKDDNPIAITPYLTYGFIAFNILCFALSMGTDPQALAHNFMFIAEEYFVRVISNTDANGNTNTTSYFNNNHILVAESDSLGNISNISLIPKKYRASKSGFPTANSDCP